jgi:hypothetical protein
MPARARTSFWKVASSSEKVESSAERSTSAVLFSSSEVSAPESAGTATSSAREAMRNLTSRLTVALAGRVTWRSMQRKPGAEMVTA